MRWFHFKSGPMIWIARGAAMLLAAGLSSGSFLGARAVTLQTSAGATADDLGGFSALAPIDIHTHAFINDPAFADFLKRLNLRIVNVCVVLHLRPPGF